MPKRASPLVLATLSGRDLAGISLGGASRTLQCPYNLHRASSMQQPSSCLSARNLSSLAWHLRFVVQSCSELSRVQCPSSHRLCSHSPTHLPVAYRPRSRSHRLNANGQRREPPSLSLADSWGPDYPLHPQYRDTAPTVGGWHPFESGPLAGRTVRVSLQELQKADHGRKYAPSCTLAPAKVLSSESVLIVVGIPWSRYGRKDKRPLDPPPVVQMKCYQIARQGSSAEQGGREFDTYE